MDDRYRAEMQAILAQFRQAIRREGNLPLFDHAAKQRIGDRIGKATLCLAFLLYRLPSPFGAQERAGKSIDFRLGQRVLFRHHARPASWLSGTLIGDPRSKQGRLLYQVTLDNGESRWAKRLNFAKLSCERKEKPRDLGGKRG